VELVASAVQAAQAVAAEMADFSSLPETVGLVDWAVQVELVGLLAMAPRSTLPAAQ
jgi:hypothetical protein